ncbi:MAG: fimbria/pilus outer membrane usher protein [Micropepsaceae bacterium]
MKSRPSMRKPGFARSVRRVAVGFMGCLTFAPPAWPVDGAQVAEAVTTAPAQRLNPTNRALNLDVEVRDISGPIGIVAIEIAPDDSISMDVNRLLDVVGPLLDSDRQRALRSAADGNGRISLQAVNDAGIGLSFDSQAYALNLELGLDERKAIDIGAPARMGVDGSQFAPPAPFSTYLNYNFSLDLVHRSLSDDDGLQAPRIALFSATNIYGFVLENELLYDEDNRYAFSRQATRLVYDLPEEAIRISVGDNVTADRAYMRQEDILGVTVSRSFTTLQPSRNIRPRGSSSFTLERESQIQVLVNGFPTRSLRLPAGSYNLSDFAFTQGSNDVQIVAEDGTGRRELANFSYFFDTQLLDPGLFEFSVSYGVYSDLDLGERIYDEDRYFASGFFRIGVFDFLTAGAYAAHDDTGLLIGGEALLTTPFGMFGIDGAHSDVDGFGTGWTGRVSYQGVFTLRQPADLTFLASTEYQSERFAELGAFQAIERSEFTHSASVSLNVNQMLSIFAGGQYRTYRDGTDDTWGANVGFTWRFTDDMLLRTGFTAEQDEFGDIEYGVGIRLTARFGTDQFASASYESVQEIGQLSYSRSSGALTDAWTADASLTVTPDDAGFDGSLGYVSNRGFVGIRHASSYSLNGSTITDSRTSLRAEGAIAWAGGPVAFGRRVGNSFAIVSRHESLGDAEVLIEPTRNGDYVAKANSLGPALVSDLSGYNSRTVTIAVPDAPAGYDLGEGNFDLAPTSRSGFDLTVGSDFNISVIGTLTDDRGQAIALEPGVATYLDDPNAKPVDFFTNREGRFAVNGLKAGRWLLTIGSGQAKQSATITVPESGSGLVRLGTMEAK